VLFLAEQPRLRPRTPHRSARTAQAINALWL